MEYSYLHASAQFDSHSGVSAVGASNSITGKIYSDVLRREIFWFAYQMFVIEVYVCSTKF